MLAVIANKCPTNFNAYEIWPWSDTFSLFDECLSGITIDPTSFHFSRILAVTLNINAAT